MNTRTVLLWHNNGEERIYFTVNPARLTVTRPNEALLTKSRTNSRGML